MKLYMYKKSEGCGACEMSLQLLKDYEIEVVNIDHMVGKDTGITAVPTFIQGDKRHEGFANKDLLETKGFVLEFKQTADPNAVYGIEVGETCPVCKLGKVADLGGCNTCTNCGAQLKCGL